MCKLKYKLSCLNRWYVYILLKRKYSKNVYVVNNVYVTRINE